MFVGNDLPERRGCVVGEVEFAEDFGEVTMHGNKGWVVVVGYRPEVVDKLVVR